MKRVSIRRDNVFSLVFIVLIFVSLFAVNASFADNAVEARKELKQMGVEYTESQFATSAGTGDMGAVKLFLAAGMDVNAGAGAALGLSAGRGQVEMVKFLLSKGAKPTSNSLQFARTRGHKDIETLLIDAGAKE